MTHPNSELNVSFIDVNDRTNINVTDTPTNTPNFVAVWFQDAVYEGQEMLFSSDGPWILSTGNLYEVAKFLYDKRLLVKDWYIEHQCSMYVVLEDGLHLSDERQSLLSEHINDLNARHNQIKTAELAELKRLKAKYPKA